MEEHTELIESKNWQYSLYKKGTAYELVIPLPTPQPGFDVFHILTDEEVAGYESQGIVFLRERIEDIGKNHTDYKHQSWR